MRLRKSRNFLPTATLVGNSSLSEQIASWMSEGESPAKGTAPNAMKKIITAADQTSMAKLSGIGLGAYREEHCSGAKNATDVLPPGVRDRWLVRLTNS
mmetsp:Transcript_38654/g.94669  ORF Transcript_38654/g.94669 Transcript_38654/m.94669 type:complete len:98 (-) Transcript_38654:1489-1782(-)